MAKIRCSNCEKSIGIRESDGFCSRESHCKSTGEIISGNKYFKPRECDEFLPKIEYSQQFRTLFDKVMKGLAAGKDIKNIIK